MKLSRINWAVFLMTELLTRYMAKEVTKSSVNEKSKQGSQKLIMLDSFFIFISQMEY